MAKISPLTAGVVFAFAPEWVVKAARRQEEEAHRREIEKVLAGDMGPLEFWMLQHYPVLLGSFPASFDTESEGPLKK